jgi:putative transposase
MGGRVVKRAYKYRFYPSDQQEQELLRTFGCVRLVYNKALEARTAAWYTEQRRVNYVQTSALLTAWKKTEDLAFLNEVSSVPLQQTLRHLQGAFVAFWEKRSRYPKSKSRKKSRALAEYTRSAFRWRDGQLWLAKMTSPLDVHWSRPLPEGAEPSTVTISRDAAGRWFVSILVETSVDALPASTGEVGIDAGITSLITLSTGEKVANRAKARVNVARIHARISDRRHDHLHKLSTRLVRENQTIVIEDLNVQGMLGNHTLARAISDAAWSDLRNMLEYKAHWYGRHLIATDRWLPSSKTCSECGALLEVLPLNVREWTCRCGTVHDRDVNAARNILAAGRAVAACGEGVRPQRESSRTRRSLVKQETQRATAGIPSL